MRLRVITVLLFGLGLWAQNAFAQDSCPEGYVSFINTKTYESVCLPANVSPDNVPAAGQQAASHQDGPGEQENFVEDNEAQDPSEQDGLIWGNSGTRQNVSVDQGNLDDQTALAPMTDVRDFMPESKRIHNDMMNAGWLAQIGFGYRLVSAIDIRLMTGYHFGSSDEVASFGLYLDVDLGPGYEPHFSMDITVTPTLHVSRGIFRYSLGLGVGIFILSDYTDDADVINNGGDFDAKVLKSSPSFELKPWMAFDWFFSGKAYMGFGFTVPILIMNEQLGDVMPWFSMDLHIGYRF